MKEKTIEEIGDQILFLETLLDNKEITEIGIKNIETQIEDIVMRIPLGKMAEVDNYIMSKKKINLQS